MDRYNPFFGWGLEGKVVSRLDPMNKVRGGYDGAFYL